ncbi:MAG: hypothetical protein AAF572_10630 [Cyanobacteria bacterium P01_B01_bin.77]
MHKIFARSLVAAAVATAGVVITASGAFAQAAPPVDETVNFQGEVGSVCSFDNVVDGRLGYDGISVLDSRDNFNGGQSGSVDLSCTGEFGISVSLPQDNGSTNDLLSLAFDYGADVEAPAFGLAVQNSLVAPSAGPALFGAPIDQMLDINMYVFDPGVIPSGSYNYNVVVTATPQ